MFNKNFYPTPLALIDRMLKGIDFTKIKTVLEPSAGKGDLTEGIKKRAEWAGYNKKQIDIDCIEIEKELQDVLKGKELRVIHNDFLTFETYKQYDLIVMNPPFDNGDRHLMKALEMQSNGGSIICLLNAETLKNPYSNARRALMQQLEDLNASVEYIPNAFMDAERKTGVEIALIKLTIPQKQFDSKILEGLRQKEKANVEFEQRGDVSKFTADNFIEFIVDQYNFEIKVGLNLIKEYEAALPYIMEKIENKEQECKYNRSILSLKIGEGGYSNKADINEFVKKVRYKYWEALFDNPKFVGNLTTNLVSQLHNKLNELKDYDFSVYNIMTIRQELMKETVKGVEDTILALFDEFSHKHHWQDETSKNVHYFNGWKRNSAFKINKRIIIPLNGYDDWSKQLNYKWTVKEKLSNIIKIFDYLDCGRTKFVDITEKLEECGKEGISYFTLKYFNINFYKKGTAHIEFLDLELLQKFNLFGCQKKGWLPPHYGKKNYKDMTTEEKEVVKEFNGSEEEYNKIFNAQAYYSVGFESLAPALGYGESVG